MRQLNNKQFDTKEGASASLSELSHPQLAPSVSQKDEIMNQVQLKVQKTINNWFDSKNKVIMNLNLDYFEPYQTLEEAGLFVNYGDNGCIAFDGEILGALRGYAEDKTFNDLGELLTNLFYEEEYEDFGFGVWNHCEYEGGK